MRPFAAAANWSSSRRSICRSRSRSRSAFSSHSASTCCFVAGEVRRALSPSSAASCVAHLLFQLVGALRVVVAHALVRARLALVVAIRGLALAAAAPLPALPPAHADHLVAAVAALHEPGQQERRRLALGVVVATRVQPVLHGAEVVRRDRAPDGCPARARRSESTCRGRRGCAGCRGCSPCSSCRRDACAGPLRSAAARSGGCPGPRADTGGRCSARPPPRPARAPAGAACRRDSRTAAGPAPRRARPCGASPRGRGRRGARLPDSSVPAPHELARSDRPGRSRNATCAPRLCELEVAPHRLLLVTAHHLERARHDDDEAVLGAPQVVDELAKAGALAVRLRPSRRTSPRRRSRAARRTRGTPCSARQATRPCGRAPVRGRSRSPSSQLTSRMRSQLLHCTMFAAAARALDQTARQRNPAALTCAALDLRDRPVLPDRSDAVVELQQRRLDVGRLLVALALQLGDLLLQARAMRACSSVCPACMIALHRVEALHCASLLARCASSSASIASIAWSSSWLRRRFRLSMSFCRSSSSLGLRIVPLIKLLLQRLDLLRRSSASCSRSLKALLSRLQCLLARAASSRASFQLVGVADQRLPPLGARSGWRPAPGRLPEAHRVAGHEVNGRLHASGSERWCEMSGQARLLRRCMRTFPRLRANYRLRFAYVQQSISFDRSSRALS